MNERVRPLRSSLVVIELLIAVGVFAFCAAVSVALFARAEIISRESADLTEAVSVARNAAETFKAAGGSLEKTSELIGGVTLGDELIITYDSSWTPTMGEISHTLRLSASEENGIHVAKLTVDEFVDWEVTAIAEVAE